MWCIYAMTPMGHGETTAWPPRGIPISHNRCANVPMLVMTDGVSSHWHGCRHLTFRIPETMTDTMT